MADYMVELQGVSKQFDHLEVVKKLNLQIKQGEFLTLLGPSGCGKTTTLRMIAGLEVPTRGKILLDGQNVTDVPAHRRNVNTVFQSYALFPHLNVYDNVAFGLNMQGLPKAEIKQRVTRFLGMLNIQELSERKPRQLSGGQQQRVAVARALVCHPKVLLLDEPLAALDLKLRKQIQIELKNLQKETGITFIYVTHDQEEALLLSDRIAVMDQGELVQLGSAAEVYHSPVNRFVAGFIGERNIIPVDVVEPLGDQVMVSWKGKPIGATTRGGQIWHPQQQAVLVIAPEDIVLDGPCKHPLGHGEVVGIFFAGTGWKIHVKMDGKETLTVLSNRADYQVGTRTALGLKVNPLAVPV